MSKFLVTKKTNIISSEGEPVILKGVNLGGWLMMEGYILHAPNIGVVKFRRQFARIYGAEELQKFDQAFRSNFIQESDIKNIASLGFNCIRLPFHYRLIEQRAFRYNLSGCAVIDQVVGWCRKYGLWLILDLHGAAGCQNHDWHSDSLGKAELWSNKSYQQRTVALWEFLADRYKDEVCIAGYDLLNEAVLEDDRMLNSFYKYLIKTIRKVDMNHILFVQGNKWATDLNCLDNFADNNICLSIHNYEPINFTFNFVPHLRYPSRDNDQNTVRRHLQQYALIAKKLQRPILVGEFGVNTREGKYGEHLWVQDVLNVFREMKFHWTYWTYKSVKNAIFPDGIYSYKSNPPWVNRAGPLTGWDTFLQHWAIYRKDMVKSWQTKEFILNQEVMQVISDEF